ncbi:MAG: DUF885 domain-containing protein [Anaerolineales bacterium]|nr:DUF885 domain-containing protein [Anaerolineales bacterium]
MNQTQLHEKYDRISDQFFETLYTYWPPHATRQGFHEYDRSLGRYGRQEIEATLRKMKGLQAELAGIDPQELDHLHALDYPVLATRMKREIYWIEKWRFWERNPLFYKNVIVEGIFNLVSRNFAPLEERLRSLVARERDVPRVLAEARQNLKNPPPEYTRQALDQMKGAVSFFEKLPAEFEVVTDQDLQAEFAAANARVIAELKAFADFLQAELLPASTGKFAIGEAEIQAVIDAEEMIDVPVPEILEILYRDLEAVEAEIRTLGEEIDPGMTTQELIVEMRSRHSAPNKLQEELENECKRIRSYLTEYDFMTIPPEMPDVIVQPMPDYSSGGGAMLTPGPFERVAQESYLKLQIPKPDWTQERIDGLWSDFNHYALVLLVIHECYPGHHTQFYLEKFVPMRASRDHDSDSNSDGWAEYAKFTFVENILAPMDPFYQLAALLSKRSYMAASIAGLEIHLEKRTLEEASDFLMEKQGRTKANTYIWVLNRATYYPTHLTYYIGSKMVRKLREDYQKMKGEAFSLKEFHDRFMSYGLIPIKVIRQDMLGSADDGVLFS